MNEEVHPWYRKWAWALVAALGLLLTLFGAFVLISPVEAGDFEAETGVAWSEFSSAEPDVAGYLEREARLLALVTIGFGLLVAGMAATLVRRGDRNAWLLAWILPATLGGTAVVFFVGEAVGLGALYTVAALVAALGVALAPTEPSEGLSGPQVS